MDSDEIDEIAEEMDSESEEVQVKKKNKVAPKEKPKSFKKPAFAGKTVGKEEKSKEEKRKLNYKGFIGAVNKSIAFQGKYFNDMRKINGNVFTERIIKYKLKETKNDEL